MNTVIGRARSYLDQHRGERVTLEELARAVGASPFHLQRRFKEALGLSPKDYQREAQLEDAKRHLMNGSRVTDAVYAAGYGSVSRFYEKAASRLGMPAREYRNRGRGTRISYATFASPLGKVLIAGTEHGLCSVKLGEDVEKLLAEEFSEAELVHKPRAMPEVRKRILGFLAGDASLAKIPLDIRGTVFQRKVWEQLRRIPAGETRSYGQIARAHELAIIEDDIYGTLVDDRPPPIAHFHPDGTYYATSLAKSIGCGLRTGFLKPPAAKHERARAIQHSLGQTVPPLMAELATALIEGGEGAELVARQKEEMRARHRIAREKLSGHDFRQHPSALHIWLQLPDRWRAHAFAEAARLRGVAIAPGEDFMVGRPERASRHVRISIGQPQNRADLGHGLDVIASLLEETPVEIASPA